VYSDPTDNKAGEGGLPSSSSSLVGPTQSGLFSDHRTKKIKVQCQTVDQFCSDYGIVSLDLVKTDTEGHEVEVLNGARETLLHRSVRFVFVEFNTILPIADGTGSALAPIAERLEPLGFRLMATYPVYLTDEPLYACFNALYFRK
jgi:hypothetical protein